MKQTSILLFRIFAMITLFSVSFSPSASNISSNQLRAFWLPGMFLTKTRVASAFANSPINFSDLEQLIVDTTVYLPVVMKHLQYSTYSGKVTDNGVPVPGQKVELWFYNGSAWSFYDSRLTDASGKYNFNNLPTLTSGQKYYIGWFNGLNPDYLSAWYCDTIDIDNLGYSPFTCDFDIQNFSHVAPVDAAVVQLPITFEWTQRPTTSDSYELDIADLVDEQLWWWTDPPLGYVNTYQLTSLPPGFQMNVEYKWFMGVWGKNGFGLSFSYQTITFQESGSVILGSEKPIDKSFLHMRKHRDTQSPLTLTRIPGVMD